MRAESFVAAQSGTRRKWGISAAFAVIAMLLIAAGLLANVNRGSDLTRARQIARTALPPAQSQVAPLNLVRPLTPEQAVEANEDRPFSTTPDTPAKQFKLSADETSRDRAVECLTQAVYYEAATEGPDGELFRADISEVVLTHLNDAATLLVIQWWTPNHGLRIVERE